jgi:hypothetical protein
MSERDFPATLSALVRHTLLPDLSIFPASQGLSVFLLSQDRLQEAIKTRKKANKWVQDPCPSGKKIHRKK